MLEAMAARHPIVATQVGNLPSIFANVAHSYTAKVDEADFTSTLLRAIVTREKWLQIGANNHKIIDTDHALKRILSA